ncbi:MAG: hypothetical protein HOM21_09920 [Halobacteriovoraceae bacterium]|nr:hypothetical protein [Halobacteriovoraceae bacterium]
MYFFEDNNVDHYQRLSSGGKTVPELATNSYDNKIAKFLGHYIKTDRSYRHIKRYRGKAVYDVTYQIDSFGRRKTLRNNINNKNALVLFGGSFGFGEGLMQENTLLGKLSNLNPKHNYYNYSMRGTSMGETLLWIDKLLTQRELPEKNKTAIFLFGDFQLLRIHNSLSHVASNGGNSPNFYLHEDQRVYGGAPFVKDHPLKTWLYQLLYKSRLIRYLKLDYPLVYGHYQESDYQLFTSLTKRAFLRLKENFGFQRAVVIVYGSFFNLTPLVKQLEANQIEVLDYSKMFSEKDWYDYTIPHDQHPNSKATELLANKLYSDLELNNATNQ